MSNLNVGSITVLGAGTMGAQIALHFANAGIPSLLLDLTADAARQGLQKARALKPDPQFTPDAHTLVTTGAFDTELNRIGRTDWIIEAVRKSGVEQHYGGKKVRIHALRRGHATNAVERGVDLRSVQEQLGHASIRTTEGYIDSRLSHRAREIRSKYDRNLADPFAERRGPHAAASNEASEKQAEQKNLLDSG